MARKCPSSTSCASPLSASTGLPMNCSAAVATSSIALPTLIIATPSAITGTPLLCVNFRCRHIQLVGQQGDKFGLLKDWPDERTATAYDFDFSTGIILRNILVAQERNPLRSSPHPDSTVLYHAQKANPRIRITPTTIAGINNTSIIQIFIHISPLILR